MEDINCGEEVTDGLLVEFFRSPVIKPLAYVIGPAAVATISRFLIGTGFTDVFLVCTGIEGTMLLVKYIGNRNKVG